MLKMKVWFWSLGLFFLFTFCVFVSWNLVSINATYVRLLETFLPGFKWLTPARLALGAAESFLYGAYIAVVFVPIHNFYYRKHHPELSVKATQAVA